MKSILSEALHTIGQAVMVPCLVILIVLMIIAVWQVGDILVETFTERKKMKEDVPTLLKTISNCETTEEIRTLIEGSSLLKRQKQAVIEIIDSENMTRPSLEALAERLLATEEEKYSKAISVTDLVSKLGPMFGLLGTLIPLGPGIVALGKGDTKTLADSIGIAFDTTIAGMLAAGIAVVISSIRKRWYNGYMVTLESIMECILEEVAPDDKEKLTA